MDSMEFTYMDHLHELPRFKAPNGVWEKLEVSMFSIDADALPVLAPSATLWNSLERKLVLRKKVYRATIIGLLLLALAIPGYFIYDYSSVTGSSEVENQNNNVNNIVTLSEAEGQVDNVGDVGELEDLEEVESASSDSSEDESVQSNQSFQSIESTFARPSAERSNELGFLKMKEGYVIPSMVPEVKGGDRFDACRSFYGPTHEFSWGPSYEYQYFLEGDTYLDTEQKYWQSASINGKLCFGKFYLETGLGITLARDKTPYSYDYLKYEHINTYEYVDSVHYDPATGETTYYISYVDVFDSVPYSKSESVEKTYSYLKIPLFAGIQLLEKQKFSTSISGGVIYNLLVSKNSTEISLSEPNSRITDVRFRETTRVKNNFSLSLHLNFEWEINDGLDLYFYPSFNYYLNPLYDGDIETQPMSVGVGIGLWIK